MIRNLFLVFFSAFKIVFKNKKYFTGLVFLTVIIFGLFIFIPVNTIPGNDLLFQLSIMPLRDYILLITLSVLTSISVIFHLYIFRRQPVIQINQLGNVTFAGFIGTTTSIFGSITCIACASTFLGFLGVGTVALIFEYRLILAILSILLMLTSLYFTSRKVLGMCDICTIKKVSCILNVCNKLNSLTICKRKTPMGCRE